MHKRGDIQFDGKMIKEVESFNYLGTMTCIAGSQTVIFRNQIN